jgi:hypothetical protein
VLFGFPFSQVAGLKCSQPECLYSNHRRYQPDGQDATGGTVRFLAAGRSGFRNGDPDQMRSGVVDELNWSASLLWQFFLTEELFSGKIAVQLIRK